MTDKDSDLQELERLNELGSVTCDSEIWGVLPATPFFIAHDFVSKEKHPLTFIRVDFLNNKKFIGIYATNGHVCFRFKFPTDCENFFIEKPLSIGADVFRKQERKSSTLIFAKNNYLSLRDKKGEFLEARNYENFDVDNFPNVEQIFPDSFSNNYEKPFNLNAKYLSLISKNISKYSDSFNSPIQFEGNSINTPLILKSSFSVPEFESLEGFTPELEFLIMPVLKRN